MKKFLYKKKQWKKFIKGDVSYIILFAIAGFSILLAGGGSTLPSQYSSFGSLILHTLAGGNNTVQLHTMQFIMYTPTPTFPLLPSISPGSPSVTLPPGGAPLAGNASMLCGTNLGLFNSSDTFLTSPVQTLTKQLHVSTIRMPIRSPAGDATELQAAQVIKSLGITPLIILHEANGAADLANDKQIVQSMNTIFGNTVVYYELGNEPTSGYPSYIANWNAMINQLKPLAPNGKFGGPAYFENSTPTEISGMATFVHTANPKPDFISWHEYTCGHADSAQYCYDHVGIAPGHNWSVHIQDTKNAITANGDTVPPIFITEWNYDSAAPGTGTDPRNAQLVQLHFMQAALQEFKKDGVSAAYQYVLNTNTDYNLVNGILMTGFGVDFQNTCAGL